MASYRKFVESKGYGWVFEVEDDDDVSEQRPLVEELEIDFQDILRKLRWSLRPPKEGVGEISDFWGPLMVMFCYAALVVWGQLEVVSWVISIWICGGGIVFAVARVLGSEVTFAHTIGALGYCTLPLVVSRLLQIVVGEPTSASLIVRAACLCWATYSASSWLRTRELERKQLLMAYPLFLFMFYLTALATGV
uniref:Protein YIPF n=1 Tax=Chrysotila carterae TaxID=13221 RepID=A0A6S9QK55_CHRCT|mmetsp:Transcript_30300/g.63670  ORF Transcript_30300/g.63670 Transcript_30300/m.63670 type:complete len:193 (+) Transcript_30300:478-1056(+)|eukprot:6197755-Pleurochrysis_carterae.AAC.1